MRILKSTDKGSNVTSHMDRVKRLISPGTKRKLIGNTANRTFCVSLDELVKRASEGCRVPIIVKKTCEFIDKNGLDQEGIFRVNGSARIVDKIKSSFDQTGDADLEEDHDVMAVASTLKLFLREMTDSTIPERMTNQFVDIYEANQVDSVRCIQQLKVALKELPLNNYNLLKFLAQFLVIVAHHEYLNKMNSMALGIVFGPNLFRCGQGLDGLKDQGVINQITAKFITDYDTLFKLDYEDSPLVLWEKRRQKVAPPRPPPPKLSVHIEEMRPVPSPRKNKMRNYESNQYQDDWDTSDDSIGAVPSINNIPASPRTLASDDEFGGRASPFALDSEGYSMIESPVVTARTSRAVEKAISDTITGLMMFGDDDFSVSPEKDNLSFATDSDVNSQGQSFYEKDDCDETLGPSIQITDLINQFENHDDTYGVADVTFDNKTKQRPTSTAFEFFESKGVVIVQAQDPMSKSLTVSSKNPSPFIDEDDVDVFETVKPDNLLQGFKKPSGPVRRTPSRKGRKSLEKEEEALDDLLKETEIVSKNNPSKPDSLSNHSIRPDIDFLLREEKENIKQAASPDRSPGNSRKPFIPPLDLTILHEHVDSSDPIPAMKAQSMGYIPVQNECDKENEEETDPSVILSPRSSKLKKKNGYSWLYEDIEIDVEEAPLSPAAFYMRGFNSWLPYNGDVEEAPMSPSAKTFSEQTRSNESCSHKEAPPSPSANLMINQSFTSVALNTDIPPSPPVDQDRYQKHGSAPDDEISQKLRQLTKKIQVFKKKIKNFEESFERDHGYRPSQSEKASRPEIKKNMHELSKARKDLKKLKEEAEMGSRSRHGSGASSSGERSDPPASILSSSIQQTLEMLLKRLEEKRAEAKRPNDISMMIREQVQEEKLAIQKSLLHFENLFGRPTNKMEKDLMRPLYDRYRSVKRILAKPTSPRDTVELETVPEDQPIEIMSATPSSSFHSPLRIPTAEEEEEEADELGSLQFAVTRDFNVLKDTVNPADSKETISPKVKKKNVQLANTTEWKSTESNLHELDVHELHDELHRTKADKRKMRKQLREFEDVFFQEHGRKVQKEDRTPLQEEYNSYKQVKARLRLLEALIAKNNSSEA
ncbi:protein FAM13A isoform X2 [Patella vulgata]|uniref:protein FAM13A isoform X2 n=1 Tax=Patella vulgata TaxID=6465 RepID=UPI00217F8B5F|nr:protein FAM13A isoform X2 [Patella vulgata]